jgi:hypothetical protein
MGLKDYGWLKRAVTEPGTDGTVRWAGAGFNVRKIVADLTVDPARRDRRRMDIQRWRNTLVPLVFVKDVNHSTILRQPTPSLVKMVEEALDVQSGTDYDRWKDKWQRTSNAALKATRARRWQQFVMHAVDERGDGIRAYFLQVGQIRADRFQALPVDLDVHDYTDDPSYRCFHVDLDALRLDHRLRLALRIIASSGTELVGYRGFHSSPSFDIAKREEGKWDAVIEFDQTIGSRDVQFFWPYTTTLVEIRLNREPMPPDGVNRVFWFAEIAQ